MSPQNNADIRIKYIVEEGDQDRIVIYTEPAGGLIIKYEDPYPYDKPISPLQSVGWTSLSDAGLGNFWTKSELVRFKDAPFSAPEEMIEIVRKIWTQGIAMSRKGSGIRKLLNAYLKQLDRNLSTTVSSVSEGHRVLEHLPDEEYLRCFTSAFTCIGIRYYYEQGQIALDHFSWESLSLYDKKLVEPGEEEGYWMQAQLAEGGTGYFLLPKAPWPLLIWVKEFLSQVAETTSDEHAKEILRACLLYFNEKPKRGRSF